MALCAPWTTPAATQEARTGCSAVDDGKLAAGIEVASDVLWRLSGHRWPGVCPDRVRPVSFRGAVYGSYGPPDFRWRPSAGACDCQRRGLIGCNGYDAVALPHNPVMAIDEVLVDGVELPAGAYRVDDRRWLVRLPDPADPDDTPRGWPCCQRLDLPPTAEGTWEVAYEWGGLPPASGVAAAQALGCEIGKRLSGEECALDDRVTSVTRENISMDLLDPGNAGREDGFGVPEVRMFLEAVNPNDTRRPARVINPDRPRRTIRPRGAGGS